MRLMFSISAQATFRSSIRVNLRFPYGLYSIRLPFPKLPFRMLVKWTFIMTEPSLRCRFTFFPMNDLALFKLKLSILSHHSISLSAMLVQHCLQIGSFSPLTMMYSLMLSLLQVSFHGFWHCSNFVASIFPVWVHLRKLLLSRVQKRPAHAGGEVS